MQDNSNKIQIIKASGEKEFFNVKKLKHSLLNAGADNLIIDIIVENIKNWIKPGYTTKQIYRRAFDLLNSKKNNSGTRYKLKQAIMELGPTGYPFEKFVGKLLEKQGFKTEVGIIVEGSCVNHEVDVIATCEQSQYLIECKYSSDQGKNVKVQVPLYVRSRVNDIIKKRKKNPYYQNLDFEGWVVTNTRFSADAMQYGKCSGLHLIAWDYPQGNGLKEMIEKVKIYPVTILDSLTKTQKKQLISQGIVVCYQLVGNPEIIATLNLSHRKQNDLQRELKNIFNEQN
ncbi:MAG: restriction endonuclease [Bacteroidales bacterium]|nr:restriction endonuclease [Bacteroidales bacterium]MDD4208713.1 restriction endonuclease [Bacteroidales bacterium]